MKSLFEQKWYNKPRKERTRIRKNRQVQEATSETSSEDNVIDTIMKNLNDMKAKMENAPKVHGFMMYKCEDCGKEFQVYLEQGIEEDVPRRKPCPFMIKCPYCGGIAQDEYCHVFSHKEAFGYDTGASPLTVKGSFYFANVPDKDCGQFRTVGD